MRPLRPSDRAAFLAAFERVSADTRAGRFAAAKPRLKPAEARWLIEVDHVDHEALVLIDHETRTPLGLARYVRLPDSPTIAEIAVTIDDCWQGRGLSRMLLQQLALRARQRGVLTFHAAIAPWNCRAIRVARHLGFVPAPADDGMVTLDRSLVAAGYPEGGADGHAPTQAARRDDPDPSRYGACAATLVRTREA